MPDILHKVDIKSSPNDTYRAWSTREGLDGWWTRTTKGEPSKGGTIEFRFGSNGGFDMKVLEAEPAKRVLWQVVEDPDVWVGTKISFDLRRDGNYTAML